MEKELLKDFLKSVNLNIKNTKNMKRHPNHINPSDFLRYALGGYASFSIKSLKTNEILHFKITKHPDKDFWFVFSNDGNECVGTIENQTFKISRKSTCKEKDLFMWFWENVSNSNIEIFHDGICSVCGRPLKDEESTRIGIGPICLKRL